MVVLFGSKLNIVDFIVFKRYAFDLHVDFNHTKPCHALDSFADILLKHAAHFMYWCLIEHDNPQVDRRFQLTYFHGNTLLHILPLSLLAQPSDNPPDMAQYLGFQGDQSGNFETTSSDIRIKPLSS